VSNFKLRSSNEISEIQNQEDRCGRFMTGRTYTLSNPSENLVCFAPVHFTAVDHDVILVGSGAMLMDSKSRTGIIPVPLPDHVVLY
jgi:hypothetical protein